MRLRTYKLVYFTSLINLLITFPSYVAAEQNTEIPSDHEPKICTGYNRKANLWTEIGSHFGKNLNFCPENQAYMAARTSLKRRVANSPEYISIDGNCCELPADDILTKETVFSFTTCPPNYVATGAKPEIHVKECDEPFTGDQGLRSICTRIVRGKMKIQLRCTKINTKRYQLAPKVSGYRKALTGNLGYLLSESFTTWKSIPLALRYGIARRDRKTWSAETCVGYPWGSLLVGKKEKYCHKVYFSQLQFRGLAGDPPKGSAVRMYPECLKIQDPLSKDPKCVN